MAKLYGMIHPNASETTTVRTVFVIGPDKKVKLTLTYPPSIGRNIDEIIRVLDALQLSSRYPVSTPVNWTDGQDVIISPALSDEQAKAKFPRFLRVLKPYLRLTRSPTNSPSGPPGPPALRPARVPGMPPVVIVSRKLAGACLVEGVQSLGGDLAGKKASGRPSLRASYSSSAFGCVPRARRARLRFSPGRFEPAGLPGVLSRVPNLPLREASFQFFARSARLTSGSASCAGSTHWWACNKASRASPTSQMLAFIAATTVRSCSQKAMN